MRDISEDDSIKGLIVRIDSPGGTVGSSQEIHESLIKLSNKIPTVASIVDIGASGGYLIACGTSHIFANSGSITGSIGVISQYYNFSKLIKFLKFDIETIKSGQMKDIGDSSKALTTLLGVSINPSLDGSSPAHSIKTFTAFSASSLVGLSSSLSFRRAFALSIIVIKKNY